MSNQEIEQIMKQQDEMYRLIKAREEITNGLSDVEVANRILETLNLFLEEANKPDGEVTFKGNFRNFFGILTLLIMENHERILSRSAAEEALDTMMQNQTIKGLYFVCSPLRGNFEQNIENAKDYCQRVAKMGFIPFAPHIYFTQFLDDENSQERVMGINAGLEILRRCEKVLVFMQGGLSDGMKQEIEFARQHNVPIVEIRTLEDLENLKGE